MKRYDVRIKRVYEPPGRSDGARVLVDRLWPRGVAKQRAALDAWMGDIAPSPSLRKWFAHDPQRFAEFSRRYRRELADKSSALDEIRKRSRSGPVTLLYGARDPRVNHAAVLRDVLLEGSARAGSTHPRASATPRTKSSPRRATRAGAGRKKSKARVTRARRSVKSVAQARRRSPG